MSSISQTKVPLGNIFFGNMIRLNKFPSWLSQNWIFFESPNDRTTCPVIHGFARTMLDSDRTLSVDRPLFQALIIVTGKTFERMNILKLIFILQASPWLPFRMFYPEYFWPNHQRFAQKISKISETRGGGWSPPPFPPPHFPVPYAYGHKC